MVHSRAISSFIVCSFLVLHIPFVTLSRHHRVPTFKNSFTHQNWDKKILKTTKEHKQNAQHKSFLCGHTTQPTVYKPSIKVNQMYIPSACGTRTLNDKQLTEKKYISNHFLWESVICKKDRRRQIHKQRQLTTCLGLCEWPLRVR